MTINTRPSVSVVIPTYNRGHLLTEAVMSALSQDTPPFEVLIVDDGSTDGSTNRLEEIDPLIRVIHQENQKRGAARMRGVREARGDFIAFLDDDDIYLPNHIATFVGYHNKHPQFDAFCSEARVWTARDKIGRELTLHANLWASLDVASMFQTVLPIQGIIASKASCLACGGFPEDPSLDGSEDFVFVARLAASARIGRIKETTVLVRDHPSRGMKNIDYIIRSRRSAETLLLAEGRGGRALTDDEALLLRSGTHRFCAALLYEVGRMREARIELREARRLLGLRGFASVGGRLWLQTWSGARVSRLGRAMKERIGGA